ncbi:hypothetical protein Tco_0780734 [Tanacetum coccineum]
MDPNTSTGRIFLSQDNHISLNDGVESNGEWDAPKYNDTSLISNEFAVKLCLEHEVKNGDKVIKKELIVALKGEIYFVKFIINPEDDDIQLGVMLRRSLLRSCVLLLVSSVSSPTVISLFGVIPAIIPIIPKVPVVPTNPIVTPEVGTVLVISPVGVLDLVDYSPSSDSDPSKNSLPPAPDLPLVSPFLYSDDTEEDGESEPAEHRHVSSSHDTLAPLSEFPLAPVVSLPGIHTTDADSSTPQRFVHRLLAKTPRHSEAFRRWRSAPLSTPYPPTTSESSLGLSSERSYDSFQLFLRPSSQDDVEDTKRKHIEGGILLSKSCCRYYGIQKGVVAYPEDGIGMGFKIVVSDVKKDEEEFEVEASAEDNEKRERSCRSIETVRDIMMVPIGEWELVWLRHNRSLEDWSTSRFVGIMRYSEDDLRRLESDGGNGNDGNENSRGDRPVAKECTYQDFMKCQALSFKGTEGVVRLIRWFEKMETVFHISNCPEKYQVKYATFTLLNSALPWWNSHKRTIGTEAAFAMSWRELMKLMVERFQELTMMCTKMVPKEEDRVEKFICGLPDNIQGNVIAAKPIKLQDAVRIANNLMDQKLKGYVVKNAENKRRLEIN